MSMNIIIKYNNKSLPNKRFRGVKEIKKDHRGAKALVFSDSKLCDVIFLPGSIKDLVRE